MKQHASPKPVPTTAQPARKAASPSNALTCSPAVAPWIRQARAQYRRKAAAQGLGKSAKGWYRKTKRKVEQETGQPLGEVNVHVLSSLPRKFSALAMASVNDVYLAPGQEHLLGHELAHVAQQKAGRVRPMHKFGPWSLNHDSALEQEADRVGEKATPATGPDLQGHSLRADTASGSLPTHPNVVIQRKQAVDTDFGTFTTERFDPIGQTGVDIILTFSPKEGAVNARAIALVQAVKHLSEHGGSTGIDPTRDAHQVKTGVGKGMSIDSYPESNNPIYASSSILAKKPNLAYTPWNNQNSLASANNERVVVGKNASYKLGFGYTKKNGRFKSEPAMLYDTPQSFKEAMFETTALATKGVQAGQYLGSVRWGYTVNGGTLTPHDITIGSKGSASPEFMAAASAWNNGTTMGTLEVTADPAKANDRQKLAYIDIPKGTLVQQIETIMWDGVPAIKVHVLGSTAFDPKDEYIINVEDVRDHGDGKPTVDLPTP